MKSRCSVAGRLPLAPCRLRSPRSPQDIRSVTNLVTIAPLSPDDLGVVADAGRLYALLDACDEPRVPVKAHELGSRSFSLYQDTPDADLWAIGPYLAQVDLAMLAWIRSSLGDAPWGIFAISPAGLDALGKHFRKFVHVRSPENEDWYFRFYDPRVLANFLPTCSAAQLADFFGPIDRFVWAGPEAGLVTAARAEFAASAPSIRMRRQA